MKRFLGIITIMTVSMALASCGVFDKDKGNNPTPTIEETLLPEKDHPEVGDEATSQVDGVDKPIVPELKEGQGYYFTTDKAYVITNLSDPLSDEIISDMKTRIKEMPDMSKMKDEERNVVIQTWVLDLIERAAQATQVQPVFVWKETGNFSVEDKEPTTYYVTSLNNKSDKPEESIVVVISGKTLEEVTDSANEFAKEQNITLGEVFDIS